MKHIKRVIIIGGGVSGLAAGVRLARTVTMPELASRGGSIVELFTPIPQDQPVDAWSEQQKEEFAASALASLSRYHDLDIKVKRVRSPKDFQTEMHLYGGALYGLSPATSPLNQFSIPCLCQDYF
jgi:phytoene dehydrogenase-like protein